MAAHCRYGCHFCRAKQDAACTSRLKPIPTLANKKTFISGPRRTYGTKFRHFWEISLLESSMRKRFCLAAFSVATWALTMATVHAATFQLVHEFAGKDGANPTGALVIDGSGIVYG